jgi:hypothetical protein
VREDDYVVKPFYFNAEWAAKLVYYIWLFDLFSEYMYEGGRRN